MKSDDPIEQKLEQLAGAMKNKDSFVGDVMNRIEHSPVQPGDKQKCNHLPRRLLMNNKLKIAAAAVIIIAACLSLPLLDKGVPNVDACEVLTSAIQSVKDTCAIHITARLRTLPQDNFSYINPDLDFVPVQIWAKQCDDGRVLMRFDKPRRQLTVDGKKATMLINHNYVVQLDTSSYGVFNCDWLLKLVHVHLLLANEHEIAKDGQQHDISVYHEEFEGQQLLVLERHSQANVSRGDYLRNRYIRNSERTIYYYFDPEAKVLLGMRMVVHIGNKDVLVFEITGIQYNPDIADAHFALDIPKDAIYHKEADILPDNEKYANMTAREAAQAFFTACAEEDWEEYLNFQAQSGVSEKWKQVIGGIEIISIGEPFQSEAYPGWYVPYEVRQRNGHIKKHNLALIKDKKTKRWIVDGGI